MTSSRNYLDFVLDRLSDVDDVTYRPMMGEYILYFKGKVIGGIYDDRFLVKPTKSAKRLMPEAAYETPYAGANGFKPACQNVPFGAKLRLKQSRPPWRR